jgi:hypothetical protein
MLFHEFVHFSGGLVRNETSQKHLAMIRLKVRILIPDGELSRHFCRNHGLPTWSIKGSLYTVQRKTRIAHPIHQDHRFVVRNSNWSSYSLLDVFDAIVDGFVTAPVKVYQYRLMR